MYKSTIIINDKKFIKQQSLSKIETVKQNIDLFFQTNPKFFYVLNTEGILLQTKRLFF